MPGRSCRVIRSVGERRKLLMPGTFEEKRRPASWAGGGFASGGIRQCRFFIPLATRASTRSLISRSSTLTLHSSRAV